MSSAIEAPVVFIFFRRPETTKKVFARIRDARPSRLYLVSDGPRNEEEKILVKSCREVVETIDWPCEVTRDYSDSNLGLKKRVITGLDRVFTSESSAMILEDDCLPSSSFFRFCDDLLDRYQAEPKLGLVSGNRFHSVRTSPHSYDFSHDALIWGWATWARTWQQFRQSLVSMETGLTDQDHLRLVQSFSSKTKKTLFLTQFRTLETSEVDSWALYFAAFIRINSLLVAIPEANLVRNIGFGGVSTHTKFEAFDVDVEENDLRFPLRHPTEICNNTRIEKEESRAKLLTWISFPVLHPIDFAGRLGRYLKLSLTGSGGSSL